VSDGAGETVVLRGEDALRRLHQASADKVRAFSKPGEVELLHVWLDGDKVVITVGRRAPIEVSASEWFKWLTTEGDAAPPEALANVYKELAAANNGAGAELVVMFASST
jgi:hypothetical protein